MSVYSDLTIQMRRWKKTVKIIMHLSYAVVWSRNYPLFHVNVKKTPTHEAYIVTFVENQIFTL